MSHRVVIPGFQRKIVVPGIPLNQALMLQETAHTPGDGVSELREFVTRRRLHSLKPIERPVPALDVHTVWKKHVKVDVEIERTPKSLDQRHRTGVGGHFCKTRLFDQMRGNGSVDDPQHFAHDAWAAGEQKT